MTFKILKKITIKTYVIEFLEKNKDRAVTKAEVVDYCKLYVDFTNDHTAQTQVNTILREFQTAKKVKNIQWGYWRYCENKEEFDDMPSVNKFTLLDKCRTRVLEFLEKNKDRAVTKAEVVDYCKLYVDFTNDHAAQTQVNTILREFQTAKKVKNIQWGYWRYCENKEEFDDMPVFR